MAHLVLLHHLACSGGTILTRALEGMPGAAVLSEIHPDRQLESRFSAVRQFEKAYGPYDATERAKLDELFLDELGVLWGASKRQGRRLIIRDHTHSDFVWSERYTSRLRTLTDTRYEVTSILSVRDPVDVWISAKAKGWLGERDPDSFAYGYYRMLKYFGASHTIRYEDFVRRPDEVMVDLCAAAGIAFDETYRTRMAGGDHLTGDSGRRSGVIRPRPRQYWRLSPQEASTLARSEWYAKVCECLGYKPLDVREAKSEFRKGIGRRLRQRAGRIVSVACRPARQLTTA